MAKTRAILKRRKAVRNIRKITRTMELIATARFKKAMERASQADAYTRKIAELVSDLSRSAAATQHPLLEVRPNPKHTLVLVLTSNRGLCGGYNSNVLRMALRELTETESNGSYTVLEVSGKRGIGFFRFRGRSTQKTYQHFEDKPTFDQVEDVANAYLADYLAGKVDRVVVVYTRFISLSKQVAEVQTLLPMTSLVAPDASSSPKAAETPAAGGPTTDYEFAPSATDILNEIVPESFKVRLLKCFLDAAVSEQIARMVAMKGATENAIGLLRSLTRRYNRARQSQITSELAEIIGTAEALK